MGATCSRETPSPKFAERRPMQHQEPQIKFQPQEEDEPVVDPLDYYWNSALAASTVPFYKKLLSLHTPLTITRNNTYQGRMVNASLSVFSILPLPEQYDMNQVVTIKLLDDVVDALNSSSKFVAVYACMAVFEFAKDSICRSRFRALGAHPFVVAVLTRYSNDWFACFAACWAILELVVRPEDAHAFDHTLASEAVANVLVNLGQHHDQLGIMACNTLYALTSGNKINAHALHNRQQVYNAVAVIVERCASPNSTISEDTAGPWDTQQKKEFRMFASALMAAMG